MKKKENLITEKQAIKLYKSKFWENMSFRQRAEFQLEVELLCMPLRIFHEAIEKALKRPVYTHEMGMNWDGLLKELRGEKKPPSLKEIINLIPKDKKVIVINE